MVVGNGNGSKIFGRVDYVCHNPLLVFFHIVNYSVAFNYGQSLRT